MKVLSIDNKQQQIDSMSVLERAAAPTPKFFEKLKIIGITLAAVSGALLTAPVALPAIVTTIAGYLAVAGTVATAVSQVAVES
jgi:hypothetical protein